MNRQNEQLQRRDEKKVDAIYLQCVLFFFIESRTLPKSLPPLGERGGSKSEPVIITDIHVENFLD